MSQTIRTYSELIQIPTFEERLKYLKLNGSVGKETFGFERYLNQMFYRSEYWKSARRQVIQRDNACDLAFDGFDIYGKIYIHHMNPITVSDIVDANDDLLNPEFLICTSFETHNAIHYGDVSNVSKVPIERTKNDTCPWRR